MSRCPTADGVHEPGQPGPGSGGLQRPLRPAADVDPARKEVDLLSWPLATSCSHTRPGGVGRARPRGGDGVHRADRSSAGAEVALMLSADEEELPGHRAEQAAEELLARMLDARRYARPPGTARVAGRRGRRALSLCPTAPALRRRSSRARRLADPQLLGAAMGRLLLMPPVIRPAPHRRAPRQRRERLAHLRVCCARAFSFDEAVGGPIDDGRRHPVRPAGVSTNSARRAGSSPRASANRRAGGGARTGDARVAVAAMPGGRAG